MEWAGRYAADKRPDIIIHLGDHYDFPSLSSYDEGTSAMEGREVDDDIEAGDRGLAIFEDALKKHSPRGYRPKKVVTIGNHEDRLSRYVKHNPKLRKTFRLDKLAFGRLGWKTYPFLQPVSIDGILYCHFFPIGPNGSVTNSKRGCPSAAAQVKRVMNSCVAGHKQGLDTAVVNTPACIKRGIIAGSFYQHDEEYLTPMGNAYWRGLLLLNDIHVKTGEFDICEVSLDYLRRRYG